MNARTHTTPDTFDPTEPGVISLRTLMTVGERAADFASAIHAAKQARQVLNAAYSDFRAHHYPGQHIAQNSAQWAEMMHATAGEYRNWRNAKGRERRAQKKLVDFVEGDA